MRGQRAEPRRGRRRTRAGSDELADVDRAVPAGDVRDDRRAAGSRPAGVASTNGVGQVEPPPDWSAASARPGRAPRPAVEHRRGQLAAAAPGDEDLARLVDPDLLDLRVVEAPLQRPEAGDRVEHRPRHPARVAERRQRRGQHPRASSRRSPRRPAPGRPPAPAPGRARGGVPAPAPPPRWCPLPTAWPDFTVLSGFVPAALRHFCRLPARAAQVAGTRISARWAGRRPGAPLSSGRLAGGVSPGPGTPSAGRG